MSKARKLSVAALLLVGGYFAALVLGGVPELVLTPFDAASPPSVESNWFAGLKNWASEREAPPTVGQLVPEPPGLAASAGATPTNLKVSANRPTWLNSSTDTGAPDLVASHPAPVEPPKLAETPPIELAPAAIIPSLDAAAPVPKARITEVHPVSSVAAQSAASPWDRWPRMPTGDPQVKEATVPATFQDLGTAQPQSLQASFHESEVVRKNSPPRDPGAALADALRTHVVIDGDTLSRLAERYLDDGQRSAEIYRLNRDVLTNPELLPIGVELRIPARERIGDSVAALAPPEGLAAVDPRGNQAMVPVPWMPKPFEDAPRAELLRPVPADRGD